MTASAPAQVLTITEPDTRHPSGHPTWVRAVDAAMSGGVAGFALWTLVYEVGLGLQWPVTPLTIVWLTSALPIAFFVARATYREERSAWLAPNRATEVNVTPVSGSGPETTSPGRFGPLRRTKPWAGLWLAAGSAVAAAVLLAYSLGWLYWFGWILALMSLVLVAAEFRWRASRSDGIVQTVDQLPTRLVPRRSFHRSGLVVLVTGLAVSVGSLFVFRPSPDDAYYVNLSTWVEMRGRFPLRDTMFSNQVFPTSYGGGFPISSVEGLIGALARLVGVSSATMAYFIVAPVLAFAAMWVLGQLARLWAPRHALLVFAMSAFFVLVGRGNAYRAYSVLSIWQGKSAAIAILLPLVWIYATRLAVSRRGHWIRMLGLTGIAFIGLTSTAAILAPAIGCALLLAAVLVRNARVALGASALVVGPILGGVTVAMFARSVGGPNPKAPAPWQALHHAYGSTAPAMVLLTLLAVLLAPLLVREHRTRVLVWSAGVAVVALLAPGVLTLGNLATSAGPVEWRLLLVPPVPTLVGILIMIAIRGTWTLAPYRVLRFAATMVTAGVAVVAVALADGAPPWHADLHLSRTPAWKESQPALSNVERLIATDPPHGRTILMPPNAMIALSMYTVEWHGVAPRSLYVASLQEPASLKSARKILTHFATGSYPHPTPSAVKHALHLLDVGTVCLSPANRSGQQTVRGAGFRPFVPVGTLQCSYKTRPGG